MNLKTGILVLAMAAGTAAAQNANVIQNTRDNLNAVQKKQANDSNAALNGQSSKPSAAAAAAPKTVSIQIAPKAAAPSASKSSAPAAAQPKKVDPKVLAKVKAKTASQVQANASAKPAATTAAKDDKPSNPDSVEEKKYAMNGKRDPFVSPVVWRVGLQHGEKVFGDRADCTEGRCASGQRIHRGRDEHAQQSIFPARERSGVQRVCSEDYRRLDRLQRDVSRSAWEVVYARSYEEDHDAGRVEVRDPWQHGMGKKRV